MAEVAILLAAVSIKLIYPAVIRVSSDIEKSFLFSDMTALTATSEKRALAFQCQRNLGLLGCLYDISNCTSVN